MNLIKAFIENHSWVKDILFAAGILVLTWVAGRLIPFLEKSVNGRWFSRTSSDVDDRIFRLITSTLRKVVWVVGLWLMTVFLADYLPEKVFAGIFYVVLVFLIANLLNRILTIFLNWYGIRWSSRIQKGALHDEFGPLFRRLISLVVYTIALVMVMHYFNQSVSSIIVSLGVGSLAVALAAKDTLANMIAGFMIMTDRPFRIGDRILLQSGEKGDVHDIGMRSTRILTFENTLIVVPNHQIVNEKVTNLSYPDPQIRVKIDVGVAYGTDLEKAKALLIDICSRHPEVLEDPPPAAFFVHFGESSLDLMIVCRVPEWGMQWRVGEELRMEIKKVFEKEGIQIPFPQRTVHLPPAGER
ncbi:MAG TPA: mechanosensitive ion channel family protein [bacterium]|nr:mechanosensitive ion channel family protein [bacterium]